MQSPDLSWASRPGIFTAPVCPPLDPLIDDSSMQNRTSYKLILAFLFRDHLVSDVIGTATFEGDQ